MLQKGHFFRDSSKNDPNCSAVVSPVRRLKLASPKASEIDHDLAVSYSPCSVRIRFLARNVSRHLSNFGIQGRWEFSTIFHKKEKKFIKRLGTIEL